MAEQTPVTNPTPTTASTPSADPAPAPAPVLTAEAPFAHEDAPAREPTPTPGEALYGTKEEPSDPAPDPASVEEPSAEAKKGPDPAAESDAESPLTLDSYSSLAVPEGVQASDPILTEYKDISLELGLKPDVAQRLLSFYGKAVSDAYAEQIAAIQAERSEWNTQINALPEFQGERRAQSAALLAQAIEEYGDPTVREYFARGGDHPGVVKMLLGMISDLAEGAPVQPGRPVPQRPRPNGKGGGPSTSQFSILYDKTSN